jgi:hypothetical protein
LWTSTAGTCCSRLGSKERGTGALVGVSDGARGNRIQPRRNIALLSVAG